MDDKSFDTRASTPQARYIEKLRRERFKVGEADQGEFRQMFNRALKIIAEKIYDDKAHFVLELIQNAEDNNYHQDVVPSIAFQLHQAGIAIENNEVGFEEKHVDAICNVDGTSKTKTQGHIGEKGIGFKSVFRVSDRPEIHSNGFHFRFDAKARDTASYVVPEWCTPSVPVADGVTTIFLPARPGEAVDVSPLKKVDARLLLFLRRLRCIRVKDNEEERVYRRFDEEGLCRLSSHRVPAGGKASITEELYLRVEVVMNMSSVKDPDREGVGNSSVVLAFPIDDKGAPRRSPEAVFAFLPLRQVGLKFATQADFVVTSSRADVYVDRPWNARLRDGIAAAFLSALDPFKSRPLLSNSFLRYVPKTEEIVSPFFQPVAAQIVAGLKAAPCVRTRSGHWVVPSAVRTAPEKICSLFGAAEAQLIFGGEWLDPEFEVPDWLREKLGIEGITYDELVGVFDREDNWFADQSLEWRAKFFAALSTLKLEGLEKAGLLKKKCLPTESGGYVAPNDIDAAFLPLSKKTKKFGFEEEIILVDAALLERASAISQTSGALFSLMKVTEPKPYHLLQHVILARHQREDWKESKDKALIGHVRYIKEKLGQMVSEAAAAGVDEASLTKQLSEQLWIGTKEKEGDDWAFSRADVPPASVPIDRRESMLQG